jgi:metallophosphoesterase superfamily enzyme
VKASCDTKKLTEILLFKHGVKIGRDPEETLWKHYRVKSKTTQLFIMPSFNEFLGGKPLNEKRAIGKAEAKTNVGPVLRSEVVDMANAEIYLLDGTFLGALKQLEILSWRS